MYHVSCILYPVSCVLYFVLMGCGEFRWTEEGLSRCDWRVCGAGTMVDVMAAMRVRVRMRVNEDERKTGWEWECPYVRSRVKTRHFETPTVRMHCFGMSSFEEVEDRGP